MSCILSHQLNADSRSQQDCHVHSPRGLVLAISDLEVSKAKYRKQEVGWDVD